MKKLLIIPLLLLCTLVQSQNYNKRYSEKDAADYFYTAFNFDVNLAFGLKDNKSTIAEDRGFDWDSEIGVRYKKSSIYMFYGQFPKFGWKNYGAGYDWTLEAFRNNSIHLFGKDLTKGFEASIGVYTSFVLRRDIDGNYGNYWSPFNMRGKFTLWITNDLAFELIAKSQGRPDIGVRFKGEGSAGFKYKFDI